MYYLPYRSTFGVCSTVAFNVLKCWRALQTCLRFAETLIGNGMFLFPAFAFDSCYLLLNVCLGAATSTYFFYVNWSRHGLCKAFGKSYMLITCRTRHFFLIFSYFEIEFWNCSCRILNPPKVCEQITWDWEFF